MQEQDLLLSRTIVELFSNPQLCASLRFKGGTALHKLHFPTPLRYSEDLDFNCMHGTRSEVLAGIQSSLDHIMQCAPGKRFSEVGLRVIYSPSSSFARRLRIKIEVNNKERTCFDAPCAKNYEVRSNWFSGSAQVPTYTLEEMLATKLRALLQRNKGRDLLDLSWALSLKPDLDKVADLFGKYNTYGRDRTITRAQAEERMWAKLAKLASCQMDVDPLLPEDHPPLDLQDIKRHFVSVFAQYVAKLPGSPWRLTSKREEQTGLRVCSNLVETPLSPRSE